MSRHRHDDANRATFDTPVKVRLHVEWLRRQATRRKLLLLECGIIRHAPFAACGRTLWELLPTQRWFLEKYIPPVEAIRAGPWWEAPPTNPPIIFSPLDAHQAIRLVEHFADDASRDSDWLLAEYYFSQREWSAEGEIFAAGSAQQETVVHQLEPTTAHTPDVYSQFGFARWLCGLQEVGQRNWNVLDFYLANYPGEYYTYASYQPLHPDHRGVALELIDDIFGHPLRSMRVEPSWRTATAHALAAGMYETGDFSPMPILADALEDAGCDNDNLLRHCRAERQHTRGCWVIDRVLGKDSG